MSDTPSFKRDRWLAAVVILTASVLLNIGSMLALIDLPYQPIRFALVVAAAVLMFSTLGWILYRYKGGTVLEGRILLVATVLFAISLSMQTDVVTDLITRWTTLDGRQQLYGIHDPLAELGLCLVVLFGVLLYITASQRGHDLTLHVDRLRESERRLLHERDRADDAEGEVEQLQVKLEHAARLSVMGEMAAGIAHELHQPLGAISNYSRGCTIRLAKSPDETAEVLDVLQRISSESHRAGLIIKRIREFVHRRRPEMQATDVNGCIRDALQLTKSRLHREQVQQSLQLADDLHEAHGDPTQIVQIVSNLILNAVDAMGDCDPEERVLEITSKNSGDGTLEIAVRDTGQGVPPDFRDRLFDQFSTTKSDGLGIGLSISRSIVESHGGKIWYTPNDPAGSTFRFTLKTDAHAIADALCA